MPRLTALIISEEDGFAKDMAGLLRRGPVSVTVVSGSTMGDGDRTPDVVIVDGRHSRRAALSTIERQRTASPAVAIFVVADEANPQAILESMRAGASEFLTWPPSDETLGEALQRVAARQAASPTARRHGNVLTFVGAKGGVGTTTIAVNCAVDLARISKRPTVIVDLKQGIGEVSLSLGVGGRYSILDAIDNLHRLDGEFLHELLIKHKSGLDILAASDQFERPAQGDAAAVEEVLRLLAAQYDHIVIDAGSQINACSLAAMYIAETMFVVTNPDVPSMRNAQRVLERVVGQISASGDRVRVILNRATGSHPIPLSQMEAALGHAIDHSFAADYKTVSAAQNSGIPLALSGRTQVATEFERFTRLLLDPTVAANVRRGAFGRLASLW